MAPPFVQSYRDLEVSFTVPQTQATGKATVHYVEAGDPKSPTLILLHGFPSSSHQYRDFIPMLSDRYHLLAPDFPGFGLTKVPEDFVYTFESLTYVTAAWLQALGISEAAIFIQDFGAPVGLRLAITGALKLTAIISQNGNIYEQGLGPATWAPLRKWWASGSDEIRQLVAGKMLSLEGTRINIVKGTPDADMHLIDPQTWLLSYAQNIEGAANAANKLDMLYDYRTNLDLYPDFQRYVRDNKVPVLAAWGKGDPSFPPPGAEAFRADAPDATIVLLDAGHFALETARWQIAELSREFLLAKLGR